MDKELLKIKDLRIAYQTENDEVLAVDGVSFTAKQGEFVAIIGKSGCGKTSLLSAVCGLIPHDGTIELNGRKVCGKNAKVGYMLQKDELFEWLSVEQNALLPLKIKREKSADKKERIIGLLEKYGLGDFKRKHPSELSGGMRQRVALIRTLACSPDLLLLDEPFSALDYQTRLAVCNDVYSIIKNENKTALLVTHDISEAISVADLIIVLSGRPAKIICIEHPDFDKNLNPLKRREQPQFSYWFEKLWRKLNE